MALHLGGLYAASKELEDTCSMEFFTEIILIFDQLLFPNMEGCRGFICLNGCRKPGNFVGRGDAEIMTSDTVTNLPLSHW